MTATPANDDGKRKALLDGIEQARTQASEVAHSALAHARDGIDHARDTMSDVVASGRERAVDAYATAREKAKAAGLQAGDSVEANPLVALIGGIAIGAAIGILLPRTDRERQLLGSAGEKLNGLARDAAGAARNAGQDKLAELGLTREKARNAVKSLFDGALAAATTAGTAAVETAKPKRGDL